MDGERGTKTKRAFRHITVDGGGGGGELSVHCLSRHITMDGEGEKLSQCALHIDIYIFLTLLWLE